MLELLIALFLVGTFALPLAQFPMRAVQQEYKSAYRMQAQRLADRSFASLKEKLYTQDVPWKDIVKTKGDKTAEEVTVSLPPRGKKAFVLETTLHSVGKKTKEGDEYRLATYTVKVSPKDKKFKLFRAKKRWAKSRIYTYQALICKPAAPAAQTTTPESIPSVETPAG